MGFNGNFPYFVGISPYKSIRFENAGGIASIATSFELDSPPLEIFGTSQDRAMDHWKSIGNSQKIP
jgi:hypothetical protein